jgi:hypothetical protein
LLVKNPVEGIRLPKPKGGARPKPFINPQQFSAMLSLMAEPYATMTLRFGVHRAAGKRVDRREVGRHRR